MIHLDQQIDVALGAYAAQIGRRELAHHPYVFDRAIHLATKKGLTPKEAARAAVERALQTERRLSHETGATDWQDRKR